LENQGYSTGQGTLCELLVLSQWVADQLDALEQPSAVVSQSRPLVETTAKRRRLNEKTSCDHSQAATLGEHNSTSITKANIDGWVARFRQKTKRLSQWVAHSKALPQSSSGDAAERQLAAFLVQAGMRYRSGQLNEDLCKPLRNISEMSDVFQRWDKRKLATRTR